MTTRKPLAFFCALAFGCPSGTCTSTRTFSYTHTHTHTEFPGLLVSWRVCGCIPGLEGWWAESSWRGQIRTHDCSCWLLRICKPPGSQGPIKPSLMPHPGFPGGASAKEPACHTGEVRDSGSIFGSRRSSGPLEEGMATRSNILAWRITMEEPSGRQSARGRKE